MFLKKEIKIIEQKLKPILSIHEKLKELEKNRQPDKEFLDYCTVRMNKGFAVEPAKLLTFHDNKPPVHSKNPWEWQEQTVTVQLLNSQTNHIVGMRRVKAIEEQHCGKGKRIKHKTDVFSPHVNMKTSKRQCKSRSKYDEGNWPLPYVKIENMVMYP